MSLYIYVNGQVAPITWKIDRHLRVAAAWAMFGNRGGRSAMARPVGAGHGSLPDTMTDVTVRKPLCSMCSCQGLLFPPVTARRRSCRGCSCLQGSILSYRLLVLLMCSAPNAQFVRFFLTGSTFSLEDRYGTPKRTRAFAFRFSRIPLLSE